MYANKLVTTRRGIENKHTPHSQILVPDASANPIFYSFVVEGTHGSSANVSPFPYLPISDIGRVLFAYVVFSFLAEVKHGEDIRPKYELEASKQQHRDHVTIHQGLQLKLPSIYYGGKKRKEKLRRQ
eukprot:978118-Pelagomonas_calceolata.AAC.1